MNIRNLLVATAAISAIAGAAFAQASDTVDAKAKFVAAGSVTNGTDLDFGTLTVPTGEGSSVTVVAAAAADGTATRSVSGAGGVALVGGTAAATAATFTLGAVADAGVTLDVSATTTTGYNLQVGNIVGDSGCPDAADGDFDMVAASCVVAVGASMDVPATATGEVTVGTITAELVYQ